MRKVLVSLGVFDDGDVRHAAFNGAIKDRNQAYCDRHGFEYVHVSDYELHRDHYSWSRLHKCREILSGLDDGDVIATLDADMCVVDGRIPFVSSKSVSYSIDTANSHCLGSWTINVNDWSRRFIDLLWDADNYELHPNTLNTPIIL